MYKIVIYTHTLTQTHEHISYRFYSTKCVTTDWCEIPKTKCLFWNICWYVHFVHRLLYYFVKTRNRNVTITKIQSYGEQNNIKKIISKHLRSATNNQQRQQKGCILFSKSFDLVYVCVL